MKQAQKNISSSRLGSQKLHLDRQQTIAQLEILGYKRGDATYIRAFLPKEDSRYAPNTGRKADKLNWEQVERWQEQGYGIYIVVNGGGHKDEDVKSCRAIFCEFDDRAIEEQIWFWREVGLPEPTLQVRTRKSVHTYWVFNEPIVVEQWRELQTALITFAGSDPALKNPSRVMRLAGAYHIKPECEPLRCDIIHNSGKRYSYEELRTAIPLPLPTTELLSASATPPAPTAIPSNTKQTYRRYEEIQIPIPESVPLEVCLARESRVLLDYGVSEGGRNTSGAKLARDLIGTANYLQSIGQQFAGDPRQLLADYASRCTPPLPAKEVQAIWKSAEKDRPTPSCQPEGVETCIRAWYWNHYVKLHQAASKGGDHPTTRLSGQGCGSGKDNNGGSGGTRPPVTAISLAARIEEILNRHETESARTSALMDLATATGRTYNEINSLAKIIRAEGDCATEVVAAVQSLPGILKHSRQRLNIRRYLEPTLAVPLLAKAAAMPTAPEYLFNTLLAASASRIGTHARIVVNPEGGYTQPCIFWTANVAHSGQAKTPPQQEILKPLEEMEADAKQLYDIQYENYEQDSDSNSKPPVRQRRLLNNVTSSTKIRIHDENPRGLLEYLDELVADYQRLNQFKNGKGDDLQLELSFWNGAGCNYDRHDARLFLQRTAFSKTGTYQWETLARLMADDVNFIASGYCARFLYCSIADAPPRYLDLLCARSADTLKPQLQWLYEQLERLPAADYLLSHAAKVLFQGWNHTLVNTEMEEKHFGLSLVYAKIESYTARLALWLHVVNAVLRHEKPLPVISGETMQHAIELAAFYLEQHKLIHAHNAPSRSLEGIFLKVQTQAEKFFTKCSKGVNASFLKTRINALKGWAVEKIRTTIFKALATAGHGQIVGEGSEMVYIPHTIPTSSDAHLVETGAKLVTSPTTTSPALTDFPSTVGAVGGGEDTTATRLPPTGTAVSASAILPPGTDTTNQTANHQFTKSHLEMPTPSGEERVGGSTNRAPTPPTVPELAALVRQCTTWVELVQQMGHNAKERLQTATTLAAESSQRVVELFSTHLCSAPAALEQLIWLPTQLQAQVQARLRFTIRQLQRVANVLDLSWEYISNCKLVAVQAKATERQWLFWTPGGTSISLSSTDYITAIALADE